MLIILSMLETREIPPMKVLFLLTCSLASAFRMGSFPLRQPFNLMENLITLYLLADVAEKIPIDSGMGKNTDPSVL